MNLQHQKRFNRLPWQRLLVFGTILLMMIATYSCREKTSIGPNDNPTPTGAWVIYLSHDGVHMNSSNDTISVRVYDPEGELAGGVTIRSSNVADSLNVASPVTTTADTIVSPWGTLIPLVYWGFNMSVTVDTIYCTAFVSGVEVADTMTFMSLISDF